MQNNLREQFGWSDYSKASKNHRNWISAPSLVNLSRAGFPFCLYAQINKL